MLALNRWAAFDPNRKLKLFQTCESAAFTLSAETD
jgi:hypothetical protein